MPNISENIRTLRLKKDISMEEMADQLKKYGVSPSKSMISRWENGKAEPSMEYARILSKYFNVSLDFLLDLTDDIKPKKQTSDITQRIMKKVEGLSEENQEKALKMIELMWEENKKNK